MAWVVLVNCTKLGCTTWVKSSQKTDFLALHFCQHFTTDLYYPVQSSEYCLPAMPAGTVQGNPCPGAGQTRGPWDCEPSVSPTHDAECQAAGDTASLRAKVSSGSQDMVSRRPPTLCPPQHQLLTAAQFSSCGISGLCVTLASPGLAPPHFGFTVLLSYLCLGHRRTQDQSMTRSQRETWPESGLCSCRGLAGSV